ncbi:MAG: WYL domain-containing protein [Firmicutes bacterium]|nr:WYL domain-containing protein [Bacillota bacterium]MBQ9973104.1 WYL domain-containing protein [Bacillota bacterium]
MAKSRNQKLKLLYLMKILQEKTDENHGLTIAEIIAELARYDVQAERKSLYDDFEMLREFGLDIEMKREKNTQYYIASRDFELPELKLLVDSVQSSKFITARKSASLIRKLENLVSVHEAHQLQRQVHVSNRIKTMNESIYYAVDYIHDAISNNRQISFQYFDWTPEKKKTLRHDGKVYVVSPWALMWDDENYYLVAYNSEEGDVRHYRVDKMTKTKVLEEKREGLEKFKNFDMGIYSKKTFGMYRGEEQTVTIRCENDLAGVMIDRFGEDVTMYAVDSEHFEIVVKVFVSPLFLTWFMNFGTKVKILSPQSVVEDFIKLAREVLAQY